MGFLLLTMTSITSLVEMIAINLDYQYGALSVGKLNALSFRHAPYNHSMHMINMPWSSCCPTGTAHVSTVIHLVAATIPERFKTTPTSDEAYAGFGFRPICSLSFSRFAASLPLRSASSALSILSTWITDT